MACDYTAKAAGSAGRVVGMDWKLGVAVASDSCTDLGSAFVRVVLRVADPGGSIKPVPLEMTVAEFNVRSPAACVYVFSRTLPCLTLASCDLVWPCGCVAQSFAGTLREIAGVLDRL